MGGGGGVDEELRILKKDLEAVGHQVAGVTRLNNKKNELSVAVRICLEATVLPEEIWLGATPYNIQTL